jgi:hypothetical protein
MKHFCHPSNLSESALVGACKDFTEDFHIVLSKQCGKRKAKELAAVLRDPETGLVDVEATAQPYDEFKWDVHCRLLRPHLTGANVGDVEHTVERWKKLQIGASHQDQWVVKSYRVGPTYDQCLNVLKEVCISDEKRRKHDNEVIKTFNDYCII